MIKALGKFAQEVAEIVYPQATKLREWETWVADNHPDHYRLLRYGSPDPGYADTLNVKGNYRHNGKPDPLTLECTDGALLRTFRYWGKDRTTDPLKVRATLNDLINNIFNDFEEGWSIYVTLDRYKSENYQDEDHPDAASWMVGEERRCEFEQFAFYESDTYITLDYKAPKDAKKKGKRIFDDPKAYKSWRDQTYQTFVKKCQAFENDLGVHFELQALGQRSVETPGGNVVIDDQRTLLRRLATGKHDEVPAQTKRSVADQIAPGTVVHRDRYVRLGNTLMEPITVVDTPVTSRPDILDGLDTIAGELLVSWRFIPESRDRVQREIKHVRGVAGQRKLPLLNQIFPSQGDAMPDLDAAYMESDAEEANGINSGKSGRFGYFSMVACAVVHIDPKETEERAYERLAELASEVAGVLKSRKFLLAEDYGYEIELVRSIIPGQHYDNVIRPMLDTRPLADFIPTTHVWRGYDRYDARDEFFADQPALAILNTLGRGLFKFIHSFANRGGNILFLGDPRTGKSSFAAFLANRYRKFIKALRRGAAVVAIDKGFSHWVALLASVWRTGKKPSLIILDPNTERGYSLFWEIGHLDPNGRMVENKTGFNRCMSRLLLMLRENGVDVSSVKRTLYIALRNYREYPIEKRTLSAFLTINGMTPTLVDGFRYYARDGLGGNLFEGVEPLELDAGFTVIEIGPIAEEEALKKVALYVTCGEVDRLCDGSRPMLLIGEELWTFADDPTLDAWFRKFLKDKPKQGLSAFLITHNIADLSKSSNPQAYLDSCPTKILFPSDSLTDPDNLVRLRKLNLREDRIRRFAKNAGKNVALIMQGDNVAEVAIPFGPVTRATCALTSSDDRDRAQEIIDAAGDDWYPELIYQVAGEKIGEEIREGWRQHAYFWPPREEAPPVAAAPYHAELHHTDPFFEGEEMPHAS